MFKRWLAILGAVVLIACSFQLLWGGGGNEGEEYPWGSVRGTGTTSTVGTGGATVNSRTGFPLTRMYIVRPAPMGGFYLIRVSLPSGASAKTAAGVKKAGN